MNSHAGWIEVDEHPCVDATDRVRFAQGRVVSDATARLAAPEADPAVAPDIGFERGGALDE